MKPFILSVFLILANVLKADAQGDVPEFGTISTPDLLMKECSFDKTAGAANLLKTCDIKFEFDRVSGLPQARMEYRVRIKIFDEKAFNQANINIPYYDSRSSTIKDVDAFIYNIDAAGAVTATKLEKSQIYKTRGKGKEVYSSIGFTFPGLTKGSVIEYRYTYVNKNGYIKPWFFQDELPTVYSKCSITYPDKADLFTHIAVTQVLEKDSAEKNYDGSVYDEIMRTFTMHNVPAFKQENLMAPVKENLQRIEIAVLPKVVLVNNYKLTFKQDRWPAYNYILLNAEYFGGQFSKRIPGAELFIDSVAHLKDVTEKMRSIYSYLKNNISWNGEQTFYADDIEQCWKNKTGSSAEMNILLLNLLRKAGVECLPILVSTHDNGKPDRDFQTLSQFNGVDVLYTKDTVQYVLDCTQKNLSFKTTPLNVLNTEAFIVDKRASQWVTIADQRQLMHTELFMNSILDSTGIITGQGQIMYTAAAKAERLSSSEGGQHYLKKIVDDDQSELHIDDTKLEHDSDDTDTLLQKIKFHTQLSNTGDIYFCNPYLFTMFIKNPFKDSTRNFDIDFGCHQLYSSRFRFAMAGNFSLEEVPKPITIRMSDSSIIFSREIISSGNQVLVRNNFIVNKAVFAKEEYLALKSFFDKIYTLMNEQIVLKKNN